MAQRMKSHLEKKRPSPFKKASRSPGLSVILPAYNAEATIERAVESVLAQKGFHPELILLDDGSTDRTGEKIKKHARWIRYIRLKNGGPSAARNLGIRLSKNALIAFLDADDEWLPGKLAHQVEILQERPEVVLVAGGANDRDPSGRLIRVRSKEWSGRLWRPLIGQNNFIILSSVLLRKAALRGLAQPFTLSGWYAEDFWLWLWLSARHDFYISPRVLVNFQDGGGRAYLKKYPDSTVRKVFGAIADLAGREGVPRDRERIISIMHSELAVLNALAGRPLSMLGHDWASLWMDPFAPRTWRLLLRSFRALVGLWIRKMRLPSTGGKNKK